MHRADLHAITGITSRQGRVFVVSGPSGVGKDAVIRELIGAPAGLPGIQRLVTATTRPQRRGETDGVDYHFLTPDEFTKREASGWFLETATFVGHRYGTPLAPIADILKAGIDVILKIETHGAREVRRRIPDARLVFVMPLSLEALESRLMSRGTESAADIAKRVGEAEREIASAHEYDFVVVNDHLCVAVDELRAIILAERCRVGASAHG